MREKSQKRSTECFKLMREYVKSYIQGFNGFIFASFLPVTRTREIDEKIICELINFSSNLLLLSNMLLMVIAWKSLASCEEFRIFFFHRAVYDIFERCLKWMERLKRKIYDLTAVSKLVRNYSFSILQRRLRSRDNDKTITKN